MRALLLIICLILVGCKTEQKEQQVEKPQKPLTTAEKIAAAHGFDKWDKVKSIQFNFNVKRDTTPPGAGRSWTWWPKENKVSLIRDNDTISYHRNEVDSLTIGSDRAFINDKFWLLVPFQLVWDEGTTIRETPNEVGPITGQALSKITVIYSDGGYTPGDAYDIYFNEDYIIQEWIFRKGNTEEPSMITTFEGYQDFSGLKLATEHKMKDRVWNLFYSGIVVEMEE